MRSVMHTAVAHMQAPYRPRVMHGLALLPVPYSLVSTIRTKKVQGINACMWQLLTAGALLAALRRPLRPRSLAPGFKVALRWRLPSLRAAGLFLKYAGPIVGVLMSKTVMYSAPLGLLACLDVWLNTRVCDNPLDSSWCKFITALQGL